MLLERKSTKESNRKKGSVINKVLILFSLFIDLITSYWYAHRIEFNDICVSRSESEIATHAINYKIGITLNLRRGVKIYTLQRKVVFRIQVKSVANMSQGNPK